MHLYTSFGTDCQDRQPSANCFSKRHACSCNPCLPYLAAPGWSHRPTARNDSVGRISGREDRPGSSTAEERKSFQGYIQRGGGWGRLVGALEFGSGRARENGAGVDCSPLLKSTRTDKADFRSVFPPRAWVKLADHMESQMMLSSKSLNRCELPLEKAGRSTFLLPLGSRPRQGRHRCRSLLDKLSRRPYICPLPTTPAASLPALSSPQYSRLNVAASLGLYSCTRSVPLDSSAPVSAVLFQPGPCRLH